MADPRAAACAAAQRLRRGARRLARWSNKAPVILLYHRIAAPLYDPWGLCVAPARFREQLAALKARRRLVAMDEFVERLSAGAPLPAMTAITFDDGYADNAEVAKPILEELRVPAAMFLTTGNIASGEPFWWDELADLVLAGRDAVDLDLEMEGVHLRAAWPAQDRLPDNLAAWRWNAPAPGPRPRAYLDLWNVLQRMEARPRTAALAQLRERLDAGGPVVPPQSGRPMSLAAAGSLASAFISVGGHGRTHTPLTALPPADRAIEIASGREEAARLSGGPPPAGFAYPHGEWDAETRSMVIDAGYSWAVATRDSRIDPAQADRFALRRLDVANCSGGALLRSIAFAPS